MDASQLSTLADVASQPKQQDPVTLKSLQDKGRKLIQMERLLDDAKKDVKRLTSERQQLRCFEMPAMMAALELKILNVGNKILELEPLIEGKVPKEEDAKKAAMDELVDAKAGGVIKRAVTVTLPKGDAKAETKLLAHLKKHFPELECKVDYDVHYQTYNKTIRDLVKRGVKVNLEKLGVFVGQIVRMQGSDEDKD